MEVTNAKPTRFELTIEMDDGFHETVHLERIFGNDFKIVEFPRKLNTLEEYLKLAKAIFDSDKLRVDSINFYVSMAVAINNSDPKLSDKEPTLALASEYCCLKRGTKESTLEYYKSQIFSLFKDFVLSGK